MASLVSSSPSPNPLLSSSQPDLPSMPSPSPRSPAPSSPPDPPVNPNPSPSPVPTTEPEPSPAGRRQRLPRACTTRSRAREPEPPPPPPPERRRRGEKNEEPPSSSKIVTPLVPDPVPADDPLFKLRSMWQLPSVLNFLHVFRSLLNIAAEFTAEELESALISPSPNNILDDIHMPLLKSIPPVTRMAMGRGTWVTVLCRKLRDWWHWVAEGDLPIVADHGAEIEAYNLLDPPTRLVILKALCDIRVEQEDIRNYIDHSIKRGGQLSLFRKERIGGDSFGISYWYEDDPVLGHRLYREIRKVETPKVELKKPDTKKRKGQPPPPPPPIVTYQWETVATNLDEFQEVSDKLFASKNRTEVSLAKKLKIDYLPEIEKTHNMNIALMQKKERLLKKQQREALLLNSYLTTDGVTSGRSLRHRKTVTYTFDDYDRSINEAIKLTKRSQESPEAAVGTSTRRVMPRHEASANGKSNGPSSPPDDFHDPASPKSEDNYVETDHEGEPDGPLDRSNRRRKIPRRFSEDFVDAAAYDPDANFDSDDDIVGEVVYDDEYLKTRKSKSASSGSEGDEEYKLDDEEEEEENPEEDDYVEEEEDSIGSSEEELEMNQRSRRHKKESVRSKRGARKLRSFNDIESGLRRSKRSTRPKINYRKYEMSESDTNSDADADADVAYSENEQEVSTSSQDRNEEAGEEMEDGDDYDNNYNNNYNNGDNHNNYDNIGGNDAVNEEYAEMVAQDEQKQVSLDKERSPSEEKDSLPTRQFLDLNDPAPDMGFDDGPNMPVKDEDMDDS